MVAAARRAQSREEDCEIELLRDQLCELWSAGDTQRGRDKAQHEHDRASTVEYVWVNRTIDGGETARVPTERTPRIEMRTTPVAVLAQVFGARLRVT